VFALEQALARQAELDKAGSAPYHEPVSRLRCFRGIDTLPAIILLAEVVDFQRFRRPRELMAYLGLVPSEDSSGEHPAPRRADQGGQQSRAAGPGRGGLALPAPAYHWSLAREPERGASP
jgi:transposase